MLDDPLRESNRDHGTRMLMCASHGCIEHLASALVWWKQPEKPCNHPMVENVYKVTLACTFVPLVAGLYWKRTNYLGAGLSIVLRFGCWITMEFIAPKARCRRSLRG